MKMHHTPWHWIAVAAVLAIALFTLHDAHGQSTGSAAVFEGRPAVSGAQGGQGPMAGPPQGGIGPQTPAETRGGFDFRRDPGAPVVPRDSGVDRPQEGELKPQRDRGQEVVPRDRDPGTGIEQKRSAGKAKRAVREVERVRRD
jgi:hypothetical protein